MGGSHQPGAGLYRPSRSPIHRLPAHVKIVAALAFVLCVVLTPRTHVWAFAGYAALLAAVAVVARVPAGHVARRALIELPFLALAVLLPFTGPADVVVAGVGVSQAGLWAAFNLLAKGTLGVVTSILLASTTPVDEMLLGLQQLRLPAVATQVATLMVRYLAVILDQGRRMRTARLSRGHDPRFLWQAGAYATSAGTLFLRSYERGERVYLAMVSRGYDGTMPLVDRRTASAGEWAAALALPLAGAAVVTLSILSSAR